MFSSIFVLVLINLYNYSLKVEGLKIESFSVVENSNKYGKNLKIPFFFLLKKPLSISLGAKLDNVPKNSYLYIPQVDASYIEIYINDILIKKIGYKNKIGHFFYSPFLITLPDESRELKIKMSGTYELGIDFPIFIIQENQLPKYWTLKILTFYLVIFLMGTLLSLSIILLLFSINSKRNEKKLFLHFSLASILGIIWLFDTLPLPIFDSIENFSLFKKITLVSLYLSFLFLSKGSFIYFNYNGLFGKTLTFLYYVSCIILIFSPSVYHTHIFHNYLSVIFVLNAVFLIYLFFKSNTKKSLTLLFILSSFILTAIHDVIVLIFDIETKFLSPLGVLILFFVFSYIIISSYKETVKEKHIYYKKSVFDNLTKAYNRNIFDFEKFNESDLFIYIDINKLKEINDTLGHKYGDKVLKKFSQIVKNNIRKDDLLIRLGGDEFLIVLKNCSKRKGKITINRILNEFRNSDETSPTFSWGIIRYKDSLEKTLESGDLLMYKMKNKYKYRN
ncbi:diguanylate cyclase (GGDEF)-like protein [Thermosipho japonicus]|uniref:Diguanylate cyclase (GGDEF)-like protein n=1 Tax=Thermosipho japonicus TaxID=90323 RepID=A0A841GQ73_9BACT|nr:diguanylate cyclase (GGDEF)-like protein [Thermosipho japonicus]